MRINIRKIGNQWSICDIDTGESLESKITSMIIESEPGRTVAYLTMVAEVNDLVLDNVEMEKNNG